MDIRIDKHWPQVTKEHFIYLIGNLNWYRDGMGNVDRYYETRGVKTIQFGASCENEFFVDPTFFPRLHDKLEPCSQCGADPADLFDHSQPKIVVALHYLGKPWKHGVVCQICDRVALGIGEQQAVANWNDGHIDGSWLNVQNSNIEHA